MTAKVSSGFSHCSTNITDFLHSNFLSVPFRAREGVNGNVRHVTTELYI